MQFIGISLVRVATGDDAGAAWAAGGNRDKSIIKSHPFISEALEIRGHDRVMPVGRRVIPGEVIRDDENQIRKLQQFRLFRDLLRARDFFFLR